MSSGGSISSMNSTLKNNRKSLTSKRKGRFRPNFSGKTQSKKKVKDKKVSFEQLELIKYEIRVQKLKEKRRKNTIFVCSLIVLLGILILTQTL